MQENKTFQNEHMLQTFHDKLP